MLLFANTIRIHRNFQWKGYKQKNSFKHNNYPPLSLPFCYKIFTGSFQNTK